MIQLHALSRSFWSQFESPRWIIFLVAAIGVLLAYVTDEGCFLFFQRDEIETGVKKGHVVNSTSTTDKTSERLGFVSKWLAMAQLSLMPLYLAVLESFQTVMQRLTAGFIFYKNAWFIARNAKTKRQLVYLMQKKHLQLPISSNESEMDSYLDCKHHYAESWPFMWAVSNVKANRIQCSSAECIPMSSYSYLDLLRDERVQAAAISAAQQWSSGNHGPRLLGGNTTILQEAEQCVASFLRREAALICTTGYLACMSATALVCTSTTVVFADHRIHASLRAGLKLGEGKTFFFRHNNFKDCEKWIRKYRSKFHSAWMVVESVYSMDGDITDLPEAARLCQEYNINLMVDEAHGLGVLGETGRGLEEHFNMFNTASLIVGTFSKSIASIGGFIAGSARYVDYISDHALGSIFSAPLPGYCAGAAMKSFQIIASEPHIVKEVQRNSRILRDRLASNDYWPENYPNDHKFVIIGSSASSVIPLIFPNDLTRLIKLSSLLKKKGFMCSAVAYPACPIDKPRFRITATSAYTEEVIEAFVKAIKESCVEIGPCA